MSNETKREVFEGLLESYMYSADMVIDEISTDGVADRLNLGNIIASTRDRYDNALPDDLPVIPKAVSEWIKECKHRNVTLADTLCMEMRPENVRNWIAFKDGNIANDFDRVGYLRKQDLMATAWLLGVWRVEETGEVVKL